MKSTSLFVELLVIGFGSVIWISLIGLSIFGHIWFEKIELKEISLLPSFVPLLAITYVLGIIVDRVADRLSEHYARKICDKCYEGYDTLFYRDRRIVLSTDSPISGLLQYGRSRARICRGWALNSILISIFLTLFLFLKLQPSVQFWEILICCNLLLICLFVGCCFAWRMLKQSEYIKTREQAEYLKETACSNSEKTA